MKTEQNHCLTVITKILNHLNFVLDVKVKHQNFLAVTKKYTQELKNSRGDMSENKLQATALTYVNV